MLKVYYNNNCSVCRIEINHYIRKNTKDIKWIDITNNKEASDFVQEINNGKKIIPTIDVEGKVYTNPNINELNKILKLN